LYALVVLAIGSLLMLRVQVGEVSEVGLVGLDWGATTDLLTSTRWGNVWLWRAGLIVALAVPVAYLVKARPGSRYVVPSVSAIAVLGAGVLLTNSLTSHAAATAGLERELVTTDFLHLVTVGAWIGALPHLAAFLWTAMGVPSPQRRSLLQVVVPRFSTVAVICAAVSFTTGLYSSWAQVNAFSAITTPYGWTLVAKLSAILPLLAIAAFNLLRIRPALRTNDRAPLQRRLVLG
jgi:putative copper resistance protein D